METEAVVQIVAVVQGTPKEVGEVLHNAVQMLSDLPNVEVKAYSSAKYAEQEQPNFFMNGPN